MSAFEFFFGFYALILGLAVVEIVSGLSRAFRARRVTALGLCTPLLGLYLLLDLVQYWVDTWTRHQDPHINAGVLTVALAIAGLYYLAASLVFPDHAEAIEASDAHYDAQKRTVILLSFTANVLSLTALPLLAGQPEVLQAAFSLRGLIFLAVWVAPLALLWVIRNRKVNAALLAYQCLLYLALTLAEAIGELA